jgi:hypothetical protein
MAQRLPDQKTPVTRQEVLEALWGAWAVYFNAIPKKESIWVLMSQWALETGWSSSMHCYNLGNVKSRDGDGYDYTYFACNEILPKASAEKLQAKDPKRAKITSYRSDGTAIIWFYPDHPGCRFRAFSTLQEGALDHLVILVKKFDKAWSAVAEGDPAKFAHLLKVQGYYTADETSYSKALTSIFRGLAKDTTLNYSDLPTLTGEEKERILSMVGANLRNLV